VKAETTFRWYLLVRGQSRKPHILFYLAFALEPNDLPPTRAFGTWTAIWRS